MCTENNAFSVNKTLFLKDCALQTELFKSMNTNDAALGICITEL